MANLQSFAPRCPYCGKPIVLETAKTDERGQAVHEDCYVRNLNHDLIELPPPEF